MKTYLHVIEIEPHEESGTYQSLPLHCTVMGWFRTYARQSVIEEITAEVCRRFPPMKLVSGQPDLFGPNRDIPVFVLECNPDLLMLHLDLLASLDQIDVEHAPPSYAGPDYHMHVTSKGGRSLPTGSTILGTSVVLIEVSGEYGNGFYKILRKFPLG